MLVAYDPNDAAIAKLKAQIAPLLADPKSALTTKEGYEECRAVLATTRQWRSILEKKRVELKADALEFGRKVDAEAKRVLGLILEIESPIKAAKDAADTEKERKLQEGIAAEKAKAEAIEKAKRDAEEAARKAAHEAEQAKLRDEREAFEAEKKRLAEEKAVEDAKRKAEDDARRAEQDRRDAELKAERDRIAAEQKAESDRLAAERKAVEDEKVRLAKIEADRLAKEKAEQEAKDRADFERKARDKAEADAKSKAESDRIASEKAAKEKAEAEKAEAARIAAAKPDVAKIVAFGKGLDEWKQEHAVELKTDHAKSFMHNIRQRLSDLINECAEYTTPKKTR